MLHERPTDITDTKNLGNYEEGTLSLETQGDTLVVDGDVDLYVAEEFRVAGEAHVRDIANPVIDLLGVPFLDSAGLASLLSIAKVARSLDRQVRVVAAGNPRRVLRITGVDRMVLMNE
jgi:anti-anti-sigma factor